MYIHELRVIHTRLEYEGVGAPWPVYLEGMEECYVRTPLVIQRLSHSLYQGMSFLQEYNLKMICTEKKVMLMPVKDGSTSRARVVVSGCHSFLSKKSGAVLRATKDQMISIQVWRIHGRGSASIHYRRGQKRLWEYIKAIPIQFPQGWGNISLFRLVAR